MTLLALLVFLLPLAYSPGPGNLFFAAHGARFGWRATLPAFAGYHAATLLAALAVGAGLVLLTGPGMARALLWAGTAYMLWLAVKLWRASGAPRAGTAPRAGLWDGAALLALNPKAWAIMAALFAQFPNADTVTIIWVAVVFTLNNAVAFALWTAMGEGLLARVQTTAQGRAINRGLAVLLAGMALALGCGAA